MRKVAIDRVYSFLGLTAKAGRLVSGGYACQSVLRSGKVRLVIVANDASQNTKKRFEDACFFRNIDIRFFGNKQLIGKAIGKDMCAVLAITDQEFAGNLTRLIASTNMDNGGERIG